MMIYSMVAVVMQLATIPHAEDRMTVARIVAWSVVWPLWIAFAIANCIKNGID